MRTEIVGLAAKGLANRPLERAGISARHPTDGAIAGRSTPLR